jgi:hypothetical protein
MARCSPAARPQGGRSYFTFFYSVVTYTLPNLCNRAGATQLQHCPLTPEDAERVGRELAKRILAFAAARRD